MFAHFIYQTLNEKFIQDSDPISDLNIGLATQLDKWIKTTIDYQRGYKSKNDHLWICSRYNKVDFVRYLLAAGANVHYRNEQSLALASYYGHKKIVELLLKAGARVYSRTDLCYEWAKNNGYNDIVNLLEKYRR